MQVSRMQPRLCVGVFKNFSKTSPAATKCSTVNLHQEVTTTENLKPFNEIPGPWSLPLIGPILHFFPFGDIGDKQGMELGDHLYKKYGPIVRLDGMLGRPAMVFLFDSEASATVLRGENTNAIRPGFQSLEYYRKVHNRSSFKEFTGLITDHGETWKKFRSITNPVMLQPKTVKLYSSVLDEVALDMVERIRQIRNEKNMVANDFDIEINKWSLESIGVVALGGRIGCLDPNLPADSPARQLIKCVHDIFEVAQNLDFKPSIWRYYATKEFKRAMYLFQHQMDLSKLFIKKAVKEIEKNKNSTNEKGVLEKLLDIDEDIAIIMAADMLFAGVDTAANTLLATMYLLAINPEKQAKLRNEVKSGDEKQSYLKAVIKESMRMLPTVSGNIRLTTKDYSLCGYHIPKNTHVIFNHQYLAMKEDQFPRPKEFIPERFLTVKDDPLYYGKAHPFTNLPFGFGARQCIGKRIAGLEMETFLSRLVQNFEIGWVGEPLAVKSISLNYFQPPYNYIFKDL